MASRKKRPPIDLVVEFEWSELLQELLDQGLPVAVIERIRAKASGDFYCLKLEFPRRGAIKATFIKPLTEKQVERRQKLIAERRRAIAGDLDGE